MTAISARRATAFLRRAALLAGLLTIRRRHFGHAHHRRSHQRVRVHSAKSFSGPTLHQPDVNGPSRAVSCPARPAYPIHTCRLFRPVMGV